MSISVILDPNIFYLILEYLPILEIFKIKQINNNFNNLSNSKNYIWKIIAKKYLNEDIIYSNREYSVLKGIYSCLNLNCGLCFKPLPYNNISLVICTCNFHKDRPNIYLKYHNKCLKKCIVNKYKYHKFTYLVNCPICNKKVISLHCNLY